MSRVVAVDTNVISKILRNKQSDFQSTLNRIDIFYIPWVVHAELLAGVQTGGNPEKYLQVLDDYMSQSNILLSKAIGTNVIPFYVDIYTTLRRQGTPISPNDLWIASECVSQGLQLFTLDEDFAHVGQIVRFS